MHAYLIIGQKIAVKEKLEEINKNLKAKIIEFPLTKIADLAELKSFTKLKVTEKTAILVNDFHKTSEEAQNAFLKSLEEPQENLFYILTADSADRVLPTIISRCEVIELPITNLQFTIEDKTKIENFLKAEVGGKLKLISQINKREEAIEFMKNLILVGHEIMIKSPKDNFKNLENANKTLRNLEANGNVQLQLTNWVVRW